MAEYDMAGNISIENSLPYIAPGTEGNILVVEDDNIIARIIEHVLTGSGYAVTRVSDGEAALETLQEQVTRFNCVIIDCMLPGIHGMDVLRRIKENSDISHIPVIIETVLDDAESIRKGFTLGAFSYITKPLKINLLRCMVHAAIDRFRVNITKLENKQRAERSLELLDFGIFHCRTLDEAQNLAKTLALACPDPDRVASGLLELLFNGIEHGNLGITYDEKTHLVLSETWREEVERRLAMDCFSEQKVVVEFERRHSELVLIIRDEGTGFDCKSYLDFDPDRALHPHGRGIAMACAFNLDSVEFLGNGNTVRVTITI